MYQKILVPLDGSELSETIVPYVEQLATGTDGKIVLTRVVEPAIRSAVLDIDKDMEVEFPSQKANHVRDYLVGWKQYFRDRGLAADTLFLQGIAVDAILQAVQMVGADLVAMSSRGLSGMARVFYGSVSSGVLNRVPCPLLLTRSPKPQAWKGINRILLPLDTSVRAEKAVPHVEAIARHHGAEIVLLHVVRTTYQVTSFGDLQSDLEEELASKNLFSQLGEHQKVEHIREARKYLLNLQTRLRDRGFSASGYLMYGRPTESILTLADELETDLIAITNQGRTGLAQVLYGSVASGILNSGSYPLLIVPV
ncbi:MAG: universal stress protein [Limnospira sp.]